MSFVIREFEVSDYADLFKLNRDELGYEYPIEDTKEKLLQLSKSNHDKIYVAVSGKEIVGYVHATDYDVIYYPHMKNIMGIAVSKAWRRKGVGSALLTSIEKWARETGAKGIRLNSGSSRTEAHQFYYLHGFSGDKTQLRLMKML